MGSAGVLDHWLPEYDGVARLRALMAREDRPDGLRRLAAVLSAEAAPVSIGKRLKLSTQETLRLEVMLAREPVIDIAGGPPAWRAGLYRLGKRSLYRPAFARDRRAGRLARGARRGAHMDAARTAGERR
jgi:poly(A) polymerase